MASAELIKYSQVFSADFQLASGILAPAEVTNFTQASTVLYIVRKTAGGGANGIPRLAFTQPAAFSEKLKIGIFTSTNSDNSLYTVYWANVLPQTAATLSTTAQNGVAGVVFPSA
jgi:hypothetical protein